MKQKIVLIKIVFVIANLTIFPFSGKSFSDQLMDRNPTRFQVINEVGQPNEHEDGVPCKSFPEDGILERGYSIHFSQPIGLQPAFFEDEFCPFPLYLYAYFWNQPDYLIGLSGPILFDEFVPIEIENGNIVYSRGVNLYIDLSDINKEERCEGQVAFGSSISINLGYFSHGTFVQVSEECDLFNNPAIIYNLPYIESLKFCCHKSEDEDFVIELSEFSSTSEELLSLRGKKMFSPEFHSSHFEPGYFQVFPNPAFINSDLNLELFSETNQLVQTLIFDINGKKMFQNNYQLLYGKNKLLLNGKNIFDNGGIYNLQVTSGELFYNKLIIINDY